MNTKKIGIIGAMEEEVEALRAKLSSAEKLTKASMDFYSGVLNGHQVVIVRSGIGKVNAGICTQILADLFHVDAVINTGIAGSLKAEINIGDIVISTDAVQHDMDATGFGYKPGVIPRMETSCSRQIRRWFVPQRQPARRQCRRFRHLPEELSAATSLFLTAQ